MRKYIPTIVAVALLFAPLVIDGAGLLQIMAFGLIFAALAITYDLLLGFTGLLSFGHAAYFGTSVYLCGIALTKWEWPLLNSIVLAVVATTIVGVITGAIALRVGGVAFAMVTLALAQGGVVIVQQNPGGLTNGLDGFGVRFDEIPEFFIGVVNTRNLYWLALALLVFTYGIVYLATTSSPGRVWQALRENESRVEVLGLDGYKFKLLSFTLSVFLSSIAGVVFVIVQGAVFESVMTSELTLTLLIMVVLGGLATRWGAALGGFLYTVVNERLTHLASSDAFADLPLLIRGPLTQPVFLLGVVFILVILFAPGGFAGAVRNWQLNRR